MRRTDGADRSSLSLSLFLFLRTGDAAAFSLLLSSISTIYTTLLSSPSEPVDISFLSLPQPTTTHLHFCPPSLEAIREFGIPQTEPLPLEEVSRQYKEGARGTESVMIRLSKEELGVLKKKVSGMDASSWISTQDALSSWYVEVLRECGVEVKDVINAINVRTCVFPSTFQEESLANPFSFSVFSIVLSLPRAFSTLSSPSLSPTSSATSPRCELLPSHLLPLHPPSSSPLKPFEPIFSPSTILNGCTTGFRCRLRGWNERRIQEWVIVYFQPRDR